MLPVARFNGSCLTAGASPYTDMPVHKRPTKAACLSAGSSVGVATVEGESDLVKEVCFHFELTHISVLITNSDILFINFDNFIFGLELNLLGTSEQQGCSANCLCGYLKHLQCQLAIWLFKIKVYIYIYIFASKIS